MSLESATGGLRKRTSYTHSLDNIVNLVTLSQKTMPVGSFKYNVHKYPGDIDIFERYSACCSVEDVKQKMAKAIQTIVLKLKNNPDAYLGDFKAGEDKRLMINIGKWEDNKLVGFDTEHIKQEVVRLIKSRLITREDAKYILTLTNKLASSLSHEDYEELSDSIRKQVVLRWSAQEILAGQKILQGSEVLTLADALAQKTLVKIDVWAKVNGRYIEVTNFFMISVTNRLGFVTDVLTQDLPDYAKSIAKDVKMYSSKESLNTLKALKRLWSLAIFQKQYDLAGRISPLFSTNAAALHQMNGEAEVLANMLAKLPDPPLDDIMQQIDNFKTRIDQYMDFTDKRVVGLREDVDELYEIINNIVDPYFTNEPAYINFENAVSLLEKFQKKLKQTVEKLIAAEAKESGLQNPAAYLK